jgi:hypothetical protein
MWLPPPFYEVPHRVLRDLKSVRWCSRKEQLRTPRLYFQAFTVWWAGWLCFSSRCSVRSRFSWSVAAVETVEGWEVGGLVEDTKGEEEEKAAVCPVESFVPQLIHYWSETWPFARDLFSPSPFHTAPMLQGPESHQHLYIFHWESAGPAQN